MALFRAGHMGLPGGERLDWLDYQVPLKARRSDRGIGKIDLLGLTADRRICIVELKAGSSREDPRVALLESLVYAAIVEANLDRIAIDGERAYGHQIGKVRPRIMLLAPAAFWGNARRRWRGFAHLATGAAQALSLEIDCMALHGTTAEEQHFCPWAEAVTHISPSAAFATGRSCPKTSPGTGDAISNHAC